MNVALSRNAPRVDHRAIQARQQSLWASADYAAAGAALQIVAEALSETVNLCEDERVLDVAAGNLHASMAAARRWCEVTATDYASGSGKVGQQRRDAAALGVSFIDADAENLPYADQSFDAVVSTFGVMFATDQDRAASEMIRVCRRGKRIGLANWTPESFIGQVFRIASKHAARTNESHAPFAWGTEQRLEELFGVYGSIELTRKCVAIRARSNADWADKFRATYLLAQKNFALRGDLLELAARFNRAKDGTMVVDAEYLEVAITRR